MKTLKAKNLTYSDILDIVDDLLAKENKCCENYIKLNPSDKFFREAHSTTYLNAMLEFLNEAKKLFL